MSMETALAKASLTRVEQRDPYKLKNKMNLAAAERSWRRISTGQPITRELKYPAFEILNVAPPEFFKEVNTLLASNRSTTGRRICAFTW